MFRLLIGLGILTFTMEHPYFIALSSVLFLFSQFINEEEKIMLKDFASSGKVWLTKLNAFSRDKGLTMKEGREQASDILETFSNLEKVQLEKFLVNDVLKDKVNSFIVQELIKEETSYSEWQDECSLEEYDMIDEDEKKFITYLAPDFDWSKPYTSKDHRQLFKNIKAQFRNNDGSVRDELGNQACIELEAWIYAIVTNTDCPDYGQNEDTLEYLITEGYKNAQTV